jgi:hypothetical protein
MKKKDELEGFLEEPKKSKSKLIGKVIRIINGKIIVDVDGNGVSVIYSDKLHKDLKSGDKIEV